MKEVWSKEPTISPSWGILSELIKTRVNCLAFVSKPRHRTAPSQHHPDGDVWSRQPHASGDGIGYFLSLNPECSRQQTAERFAFQQAQDSEHSATTAQEWLQDDSVNAPNPDPNPNQRLCLLYLLYDFLSSYIFQLWHLLWWPKEDSGTGKHVSCCIVHNEHLESWITRL